MALRSRMDVPRLLRAVVMLVCCHHIFYQTHLANSTSVFNMYMQFMPAYKTDRWQYKLTLYDSSCNIIGEGDELYNKDKPQVTASVLSDPVIVTEKSWTNSSWPDSSLGFTYRGDSYEDFAHWACDVPDPDDSQPGVACARAFLCV